MLIIYVDSDANMQERLADVLGTGHRLVSFAELYEAYKWIKHNDVPDMIITEMDLENSMGLQSLRFLQSKAKLKQTHLVGFTHQAVAYAELLISEGAAALFPKETLPENMASYIKATTGGSRKNKTLKDIETARGLKKPAYRKKTAH